ncbi:hypothetical protein AX660_19210 [Paraglaciecola hydrolytica]|uniref:Cadherin domain-containing protein n=2 Tax=Paraglaciecola hydrolytica TaxID=1799789 RepID=A0A148KMY2_9ALTE|nr:hypothetical protein AX660_19210 [Paraglaciecola hydrolytica]
MDENTSVEVALQFSDVDGDNVNITVNETHNYLTTSINGSTLTLTASEVEATQNTTIQVVASDGKASTTKTLSLTVKNIIQVINGAPVITMDSTPLEVKVGEKIGFIGYTVLDPDGDQIDVSSLQFQADEGLYVEPFDGWFDVRGDTVGLKTVKWSVADIHGNRSEAFSFTVNVIEDTTPKNDYAPKVRFNEDKDGKGLLISMSSDEEYFYTFTITDEDGDTNFDCRFDIQDTFNLPDTFTYQFDCKNRWLKVKTGFVGKDGIAIFSFLVNDGKNNSQPTTVSMNFLEQNTEEAQIILGEFDRPFFKIGKNSTKTLSYTIKDDLPENVKFEKIEYWYGDMDEVSISHENGLFTITANDVGDYGETYGFAAQFFDGSILIQVNLEIMVIANIDTEINREALKMKLKYENSYYQTREYNLLGYFYTDYLFNIGKINSLQKEQYENKLYGDNRAAYSIILQYIGGIQLSVDTGEFETDDGLLGSYNSLFNSFLENLVNTGEAIVPIINELAALDDKLFTVEFSKDYEWLDEDKTFFSRFIGNAQYGEYNKSNKWVYSDKYKLLRALSQRTNTTDFVN